MYNKKKGQASLDFLATYGWAFLIIIVAVAGLAYFDVFSFDKYLPESCNIDQDIMCGTSYRIVNGSDDDSSIVQIQLKNNMAEKINITKFYINEKNLHDGGTDGCTSDGNAFKIGTGTADENAIILPGKTIDLTISNWKTNGNCGIADNSGNKKTFIIKFDYDIAGTSITGQSSGTLTTEVISE